MSPWQLPLAHLNIVTLCTPSRTEVLCSRVCSLFVSLVLNKAFLSCVVCGLPRMNVDGALMQE